MLKENLKEAIKQYVNKPDLKKALGLGVHEKIDVLNLAQGEYNLNFRLITGKNIFVFRVNTGSQMNITDQISYEFNALNFLTDSGVTPKPYYLDASKKDLPFGVLVMEYLPGEHLDYRYDLLGAATTFARIHSLPLKDQAAGIIKENYPFNGIYDEAQTLLEKYFSCDYADKKIKVYLERILFWAQEAKKQEQYFVNNPWQSVINTEVNSHNFIVNKERGITYLVDWEKPIIAEPAQDLSHFLVPTTTLWKRNYRLNYEEEKSFLQAYLQNLSDINHKETLVDRVEMFKPFIHLRAISWCAMAWVEYTSPDRPLRNEDTFAKIKAYLEPEFLQSLFSFLKQPSKVACR